MNSKIISEKTINSVLWTFFIRFFLLYSRDTHQDSALAVTSENLWNIPMCQQKYVLVPFLFTFTQCDKNA